MDTESLTTNSFQQLSKTEKVILVITHGKKIVSRTNKNNFIQLYSLSGLLFEIWYTNNKTTITKVILTTEDQAADNYTVINDIVKHKLHLSS